MVGHEVKRLQNFRANAPVKPTLARADLLDRGTRSRFEAELHGAIKRRSTGEKKLAGALRAVAPLSPSLRALMAESAEILLKRGACDREIYLGSLRSLAEASDKRLVPLLKSSLDNDADFAARGGTAALCAACFSRDPSLSAPLARIAGSRQSHMAFGADVARVLRGESNGSHLATLAPMIKESHRIALCAELFVPLERLGSVPLSIAPALAVLRSAERHLGRWLTLGRIAQSSGDSAPLKEARERAIAEPTSAKAAWSLVAWSLSNRKSRSQPSVPDLRLTQELMARLSDRPSADRDASFFFQIAHAPTARGMLDAFAKSSPLSDETAVRAALYLARFHGRDDMRVLLRGVAEKPKQDDLRGLAAAALWDLGDRDDAREIAEDLVVSKSIGNVAWGSLIRSGGARGVESKLVTETSIRWIQRGWLE